MASSFVVVLKTGRLYEWDLAKGLLDNEGIPSHGQEHSIGGLVTAIEGAPAPGPGVSFALLVPEQQALRAAALLEAAGLSPGTEPALSLDGMSRTPYDRDHRPAIPSAARRRVGQFVALVCLPLSRPGVGHPGPQAAAA